MKKAYEKEGMEAYNILWHNIDDSAIVNFLKKPSFKDVFARYEKLNTTYNFNQEEIKQIEKEYPLIRDAYHNIGMDEVKKLKYNQKTIKTKLLSIDNDKSVDDKIFHILKDKVPIGEFITKNNAVDLITDAYFDLGIDKQNIKGTDLKKWFEITSKYKRINGDTTYGFIVESPKVFY